MSLEVSHFCAVWNNEYELGTLCEVSKVFEGDYYDAFLRTGDGPKQIRVAPAGTFAAIQTPSVLAISRIPSVLSAARRDCAISKVLLPEDERTCFAKYRQGGTDPARSKPK